MALFLIRSKEIDEPPIKGQLLRLWMQWEKKYLVAWSSPDMVLTENEVKLREPFGSNRAYGLVHIEINVFRVLQKFYFQGRGRMGSGPVSQIFPAIPKLLICLHIKLILLHCIGHGSPAFSPWAQWLVIRTGTSCLPDYPGAKHCQEISMPSKIWYFVAPPP